MAIAWPTHSRALTLGRWPRWKTSKLLRSVDEHVAEIKDLIVGLNSGR
ncbi:hypothetical protein H7J71_28430 [Mycolicibacterium peregrinum]|nr:hypothetical protein [Mycolicibacterium peregrinum]MCV7205937.1 hypothetical protein [Mycolicibacterium peregrinum]